MVAQKQWSGQDIAHKNKTVEHKNHIRYNVLIRILLAPETDTKNLQFPLVKIGPQKFV